MGPNLVFDIMLNYWVLKFKNFANILLCFWNLIFVLWQKFLVVNALITKWVPKCFFWIIQNRLSDFQDIVWEMRVWILSTLSIILHKELYRLSHQQHSTLDFRYLNFSVSFHFVYDSKSCISNKVLNFSNFFSSASYESNSLTCD